MLQVVLLPHLPRQYFPISSSLQPFWLVLDDIVCNILHQTGFLLLCILKFRCCLPRCTLLMFDLLQVMQVCWNYFWKRLVVGSCNLLIGLLPRHLGCVPDVAVDFENYLLPKELLHWLVGEFRLLPRLIEQPDALHLLRVVGQEILSADQNVFLFSFHSYFWVDFKNFIKPILEPLHLSQRNLLEHFSRLRDFSVSCSASYFEYHLLQSQHLLCL